MSMFDRLKTIRSKMATQGDEALPGGGASTSGDDGASMWDLVADPEDSAPAPAKAPDAAPAKVEAKAPEPPAPKPEPVAKVAAVPPPEAEAPAPVVRAAPEPEPEKAPPPAAKPVAEAAAAAPKEPPVQAKRAPEPEAEPEADRPRRAGRVKTRLIGFDRSDGEVLDVVEAVRKREPAAGEPMPFPVGWLVIVGGPGRGESFPLLAGVSQIGRDEGQAVQLDFGDTTISRSNHASVAFDDEQRGFFIGHGGKSNLVRLNGKPLLSTEALKQGDQIRIGETTLRLVTLCSDAFSWADPVEGTDSSNG